MIWIRNRLNNLVLLEPVEANLWTQLLYYTYILRIIWLLLCKKWKNLRTCTKTTNFHRKTVAYGFQVAIIFIYIIKKEFVLTVLTKYII